MKFIIGLGNPGKKYAKTRHNVGFMVVDALASHATRNTQHATRYQSRFKINKKLKSGIYEGKIGNQRVVLAKPMTFMNQSGNAVKPLNTKYKIPNTNLYVIHDDLDIPLGSFKIQFGKGPKEHKGVESVERVLGTKGFWRVRIGIENRNSQLPTPNSQLTGEDYVLGEFSREEMEVLEKTIPMVVETLLEKIKSKFP